MKKKKPKVIAIFIAYKAEKTLKQFWKEFPRQYFDECILVVLCFDASVAAGLQAGVYAEYFHCVLHDEIPSSSSLTMMSEIDNKSRISSAVL